MNPHTALDAFQHDNDRAIAAMVAERNDAKLRDFVQRIRNLNEPGRTEFMWSLLALAMHAPKGAEMIERRLLAAELLNVKVSRKGAK
jgi:hypothetical protein